MRRALPALIAVVFIGLGCKSKAQAYPVLVVDDAHLMLQRVDGSKGVEYTVPPGPGLILDARAYTFRIPAQLGVSAPDSVSIGVGKGLTYSAEWRPTDGRQRLDASTLTPVGEAPPFGGFPAGSKVVLGIGHSATEGEVVHFSVIWAGLAEVKQATSMTQ